MFKNLFFAVVMTTALVFGIAAAEARHFYRYSLCTLAQEQTDRDPVTSIVLERYAQNLDVKFRFASGKTIKRTDQYEIVNEATNRPRKDGFCKRLIGCDAAKPTEGYCYSCL
jgi:hypothetical protein